MCVCWVWPLVWRDRRDRRCLFALLLLTFRVRLSYFFRVTSVVRQFAFAEGGRVRHLWAESWVGSVFSDRVSVSVCVCMCVWVDVEGSG